LGSESTIEEKSEIQKSKYSTGHLMVETNSNHQNSKKTANSFAPSTSSGQALLGLKKKRGKPLFPEAHASGYYTMTPSGSEKEKPV
jgi:hypothetical protein